VFFYCPNHQRLVARQLLQVGYLLAQTLGLRIRSPRRTPHALPQHLQRPRRQLVGIGCADPPLATNLPVRKLPGEEFQHDLVLLLVSELRHPAQWTPPVGAGPGRLTPVALRAPLLTHPGVGPLTALGTVLILGPVERFPDAKHVTSYVGLIPQEESSGGRQRFGHLTKQGNRLLRFLLVEAAQTASRIDPGLRRAYRRLTFRRGRASAKVAVARKLAIRLYPAVRDCAIRSITKNSVGEVRLPECSGK